MNDRTGQRLLQHARTGRTHVLNNKYIAAFFTGLPSILHFLDQSQVVPGAVSRRARALGRVSRVDGAAYLRIARVLFRDAAVFRSCTGNTRRFSNSPLGGIGCIGVTAQSPSSPRNLRDLDAVTKTFPEKRIRPDPRDEVQKRRMGFLALLCAFIVRTRIQRETMGRFKSLATKSQNYDTDRQAGISAVLDCLWFGEKYAVGHLFSSFEKSKVGRMTGTRGAGDVRNGTRAAHAGVRSLVRRRVTRPAGANTRRDAPAAPRAPYGLQRQPGGGRVQRLHESRQRRPAGERTNNVRVGNTGSCANKTWNSVRPRADPRAPERARPALALRRRRAPAGGGAEDLQLV
ncbi:hypothetical protein EVAR_14356_1 [Eumeta japonica]|uniref:Uncharacterized protein n=1 Tax=Eumeta variegata TaxID=151549 RepID=A0A4C1TYB0_EUMVA|nr:hypothetical protein EVAR_14356_1 [Eumeta japonica]